MAKTDARISLRELNRATLARQLLLERAAMTPVAAVEQLIGMQAQEARPPFIGLWSRLRDARRDEMIRAINARRLVRATLMRGTIHLFSAADYRAFRPAIQPVLDRTISVLGSRSEGLDAERVLPAAYALLAENP
ncbi:MAG: winged helix DNA-binding domain-containing protein, partial [Chloroflexota bacterium]|nr:winged helix DNA-binding domain-containing protein [Chloroflexota bacterium]